MRKLAALLLTLALSAAAFLTPFFALPVAAAADYSVIRVRLSASYDDIDLGVKGVYLLKETGAIISSDINISLSGSQLVVRSGSNVLYTGTEFTLVRQSGMLRQYNRQHGWRHYLGDMNYKVAPDGLGGYKLAVTNYVGLEDYLVGVVGYEMSNSFPLEALKAQAVAARSYAASKISPKASYDIVDTASDQVYKGYDASLTNVIAAVNATKGQVLVNASGAVIMAYYSASNGGQTETTLNAWGTALPYYEMKDDPYDLRNPQSPVAKLTIPKVVSEASPLDASLSAFLKSQVSPRLYALGYSGFTDTFSIVGCSAATPYAPKYAAPSRCYTRVKLYLTVAVSGAGSSVAPPQFLALQGIPDYVLYVNENRLVTLAEKAQIEAEYYALVSSGGAGGSGAVVPVELDLAFSDLASAGLFTNSSLRMYGAEETATAFELVNRRYGHGVGMSQRGAQQMASEGMSYMDILNFYYSNVSIAQISTVSTIADGVDNPAAGPEPVLALPEPAAVSGHLSAQTAVRAKPSSSASTVVTLKSGASVQIAGHHDGWFLVLTSSGKCGYLPEGAVSLNLDDGVIAMATENFPLLADASSGAAVLGTVEKGDCVQLIASSGSYYFVDVGVTTGFAPKSKLDIIVGGIEFSTASDARYGYATSAAPLLKSLSDKKVLATIPEGYVFQVLTQTKDHVGYNVIYKGQKGVVYQSQTKLLAAGAAHPNPRQLLEELSVSLWPGTVQYVANTESLNLRASNSASSAILGTLQRGEKVVVLGSYGTWSKVQASCGLVGYVNATYLSSTLNATTGSSGSTGSTGSTGGTGGANPVSSAMTGTVNASSLNIRSGPSTGTASLGKLAQGTVVTLLAQNGDWYKISYNGITGYVLKTYITRSPAVQTGTVNASSLNVRQKASTSAAILGKLNKGDVVVLAAQSGDWYKIEYNGGYGYVLKTYITRNSTSLPEESGSSGSGSPSGSESAGSSGSTSGSGSAITGVVTGSNVNIRAEKSTSSAVLGTLQKGAVVRLLAQSTSWYKIEYNGITGYVMKTYIERGGSGSSSGGSSSCGSSSSGGSSSGYTAVATGVISGSNVNFRKGPGTSYDILGVLQKGATVEIIAKSGDYYKIAYSGVVGYVLKSAVGNITSISGSSGTATAATKKGKVTATSLKVRSASGKEIDRIGKDTLVEIIAESGDRYQVKYNGGAGFVAKSYIKVLPSSAVGVVSTSVKLRAGPGTSHDAIDTLSARRIVEILEDLGGWLKVNVDGVTGYVSASYVAR